MTYDLPLTSDDIGKNFDSIYIRRGSEYHREKHVLKYDIYDDGPNRWLVRSRVQGNYLYRQHIEIEQNSTGCYIEADCDCPVGYNCKHSAAVLMEIIADSSAREKHSDSAHLWLKKFDTLQKNTTPQAKNNNDDFLIIRLFDGKYNDLAYYRARYLKNGTISKGYKLDKDLIRRTSTYHKFITDDDRILIEQLAKLNISTNYFTTIEKFIGEYGSIMLRKLVLAGKGHYRDHSTPLTYDSRVRPLDFVWQQTKNHTYKLVPQLEKNIFLIATTVPPMGIDTQTDMVFEFDTNLETQELNWMLEAPSVTEERAYEISMHILKSKPEMEFPTPHNMESKQIQAQPTPRLYLEAFNDSSTKMHRMVLSFDYEAYNVYPFPKHKHHRFIQQSTAVVIHRDLKQEAKYVKTLEDYGFVYSDMLGGFVSFADISMHVAIERWRVFLSEGIPILQDAGWNIEIDPYFDYSFDMPDAIMAEADDEDGWFSLTYQVRIGTQEVPLLPIVSQLLDEYDDLETLPSNLNLQYAPGRYIHVATQEITPILQTLFELYDGYDGEKIKVDPYDAHFINIDETTVWKGAEALKELAQKLQDFHGIERIEPADTLQATLRPYQRFGLDWLHFLHSFGFGGILADDMGLGKTIQTLAFLQYLKTRDQLSLPSLIIVPTSLLGNWKREIGRFTPDLSVLELYGQTRHTLYEQIDKYDIILTTYSLITRDQSQYDDLKFAYVILDEAQKIKNPTTKMARIIKQMSAKHRLALTGTPMENHLGELWSLFDFVMPGFLGGLKTFKEAYQRPIEKDHDPSIQDLLSRKTAPFVLRRTKENVATELPPKSEIIRRVRFEPKQAKLYENIRIAMEEKVREAIRTKGAAQSHITILDALLKLRQICNHPQLLKLTAAQKVTESAKTDLFFELLDELIAEGRKILVFSQFTKMLSILEDGIKARKYRYTKLTGATRKREEAISRFTDGDADIFLISLKAGGVGLNLVAADTVIHYDPWWNPAVENQATDRAYRIGQDKPVFVYKLIVEDTVEEKILQLQNKKKALTEAVYSRQNKTEERFDSEELAELLGL